MSSVFARFQPPPPRGWITEGEKDCQLLAFEDGEEAAEHTSFVDTQLKGVFYPAIMVREEDSKRAGAFEGLSSFLPAAASEESWWKGVWAAWWERGTLAALERAGVGTASVLKCAKRVYRLCHWVAPPLQDLSAEEIISKFSIHLKWGNCIVRAIALHPRLQYIAIARQDNEVDVRCLSSPEQRMVLRDRKQKAVTCMEWAPHCDSLLAVGASAGLLLWHVDPTSPTTKFVSTWVRYESSPGHTPITSLSWSPWGNYIVSCSPRDSQLLLWDVPLGVGTCIRRGARGGVANVAWSPDGRRVFAGNVPAMFHVWETHNWTCECWKNVNGRCKAACWSDAGEMLLFAVEGDPSLYYLSFRGNEGLSTAIKCADLSSCPVANEIIVGGNVQAMAWDGSSQRLALTFTESSPSADLVAIFRTRKSELLEVLPGGFVRGEEGERPVLIAFKPHYDPGALLVVVWSSGRISFIPFHFKSVWSQKRSEEVVLASALQPPLIRESLNSTQQHTPISTPLYSLHK